MTAKRFGIYPNWKTTTMRIARQALVLVAVTLIGQSACTAQERENALPAPSTARTTPAPDHRQSSNRGEERKASDADVPLSESIPEMTQREFLDWIDDCLSRNRNSYYVDPFVFPGYVAGCYYCAGFTDEAHRIIDRVDDQRRYRSMCSLLPVLANHGSDEEFQDAIDAIYQQIPRYNLDGEAISSILRTIGLALLDRGRVDEIAKTAIYRRSDGQQFGKVAVVQSAVVRLCQLGRLDEAFELGRHTLPEIEGKHVPQDMLNVERCRVLTPVLMKYFQRKEWRKAAEVFRAIASDQSDLLETLKLDRGKREFPYAIVLGRTGHREEARAIIESRWQVAVRRRGDFSAAWEGACARAAGVDDLLPEIMVAYDRTMQSTEPSSPAFVWLIQVHFELGDFERAAELLRQADIPALAAHEHLNAPLTLGVFIAVADYQVQNSDLKTAELAAEGALTVVNHTLSNANSFPDAYFLDLALLLKRLDKRRELEDLAAAHGAALWVLLEEAVRQDDNQRICKLLEAYLLIPRQKSSLRSASYVGGRRDTGGLVEALLYAKRHFGKIRKYFGARFEDPTSAQVCKFLLAQQLWNTHSFDDAVKSVCSKDHN